MLYDIRYVYTSVIRLLGKVLSNSIMTLSCWKWYHYISHIPYFLLHKALEHWRVDHVTVDTC